jgi:hypothetical protein
MIASISADFDILLGNALPVSEDVGPAEEA